MKFITKLLILLALATGFASCEKDEITNITNTTKKVETTVYYIPAQVELGTDTMWHFQGTAGIYCYYQVTINTGQPVLDSASVNVFIALQDTIVWRPLPWSMPDVNFNYQIEGNDIIVRYWKDDYTQVPFNFFYAYRSWVRVDVIK